MWIEKHEQVDTFSERSVVFSDKTARVLTFVAMTIHIYTHTHDVLFLNMLFFSSIIKSHSNKKIDDYKNDLWNLRFKSLYFQFKRSYANYNLKKAFLVLITLAAAENVYSCVI